jgi:parvulin-like peptidyl-prolyl isomerase
MVLVTCLVMLAAPGAGQELIERTLALVGGQAITLSDARAALALGLVAPPASGDPIPAVTATLVDRELVLREVQRYAPPAPADSVVEARLDEIRGRFPAAGALARLLEAHGFTEFRLRAWVRDDLRAQAYLAQRFASASVPTDADVSAAYRRQRAEFDAAGQTFEQAEPVVRERLAAARRAELIVDWVTELRRRTDVLILAR